MPAHVSARVHSHAAVPSPSGSGCFAYVQAFTLRTPCERTDGSRHAIRDQSPSSAPSVTSRSAPGAPEVSRAGVSSPRSVTSRVEPLPVSARAFQPVQLPDGAGLATGGVIPSWPSFSGAGASPGLSRSRSPTPVTHGAVR